MFVSCNIAENYWVGRSGFLFFFIEPFFFRTVRCITMLQSLKTDIIHNILIYFPWRISLDMFGSCQFGLKLIHMNQKYVFLFSSLLESIKSFGSGGFKQGRSGYRKQT